MLTKPSFKGKTKAENRRHPRLQLQLEVRFAPMRRGELPNANTSYAEDMGAGGMAMHSDMPLVKNQLITLNLYLPQLTDHIDPKAVIRCDVEECEAVTVLARVVWTHKDVDGGYMNGLAFYDVDNVNKKKLKHFLVDFELDQLDVPPVK